MSAVIVGSLSPDPHDGGVCPEVGGDVCWLSPTDLKDGTSETVCPGRCGAWVLVDNVTARSSTDNGRRHGPPRPKRATRLLRAHSRRGQVSADAIAPPARPAQPTGPPAGPPTGSREPASTTSSSTKPRSPLSFSGAAS